MVGDCGYIGYPSISREREPDDQIAAFGYLYDGFAGIHLVSSDLDSLRTFFAGHQGHTLHTFGDGDPAFGDGGDDLEEFGGSDEYYESEEEALEAGAAEFNNPELTRSAFTTNAAALAD
jgi:hypothetical protein